MSATYRQRAEDRKNKKRWEKALIKHTNVFFLSMLFIYCLKIAWLYKLDWTDVLVVKNMQMTILALSCLVYALNLKYMSKDIQKLTKTNNEENNDQEDS